MQVSTRRAVPADAETLFIVRTAVRENHLSREELADLGITPASVAVILDDANHSCWVAEADGQIVGFSIADLNESYVFALFVLRECESMGIGRRLLTLVEEDARRAGNAALWLSSGTEPESRASGFYRHLGWIADGCLEDGQVVFRKQVARDQTCEVVRQ
jgi:ribosomal protein S18 acetylase RimI-like enzyme